MISVTRLSQAPAPFRYVGATSLTLAVIAGRLALDPWWGLHQNRHLVFLPTVMLSAWLGGYGPGLVSATLCTVAIDYFWTEPRYVLLHPTFELFLFFFVAVATCKLIGSLHAARAKAEAAWRAGLLPIVCIGETLAEREAGRTLSVLESQLKGSVPAGATAAKLVVAYEPVWAIGTGKTPTTPEVAAAHAHIRKVLGGLTPDAGAVRLLYGGSVKGSNAAELLAAGDVDGALVGGASLKADEFLAIAKAV